MIKVAETDQLRQLSVTDKLALIETLSRLVREDLAEMERKEVSRQRRARKRAALAETAQALCHDYATDPELTVFTALDSEDFHEEG